MQSLRSLRKRVKGTTSKCDSCSDLVCYVIIVILYTILLLYWKYSHAVVRVVSPESLSSQHIINPSDSIMNGNNEYNRPEDKDYLRGTALQPTTGNLVNPVELDHISSSAQQKKDVVVGMAMNIDPKNFVVFCATLRGVSQADAVIFINRPVSPRVLEIAGVYAITLEEFDISSQSTLMRNYHASTLRWSMMYDFFQRPNIIGKYGRVWMIDVRDSMFQKDPFSILPVYKPGASIFLAFRGVESKKISECGWNSGWIRDCFGQSTVTTFGNEQIICSGFSAGTIDSVLPYLKKMSDITKGNSLGKGFPSHNFPQCERNGVDQGVHNVLVHLRLIDGLRVIGQADGPVANMQAKVAEVKNFAVFNKRGELSAVVHQYDRHAALQKKLFGTFVYWTDTNDRMSEWRDTPECAQYGYKMDTDLFLGSCDLTVKGGATGPATCCKLCSSTPLCKAFVYTVSGTCFLKSCSRASHGNNPAVVDGAVSGYNKFYRKTDT